jgi:hypothetical protein
MAIETHEIGEEAASRGALLAAFVADLERLRRDAGQPSLRKMSETVHYSHTALSSVLSGTRLPSQDLTLAFVRACRGDEDVWRARWQRENAILYPTVATPVDARPASRSARVRGWVIAAAAFLVALTAAAVFVSWRADRNPAPAATPAAADGADPQEQHCQVDAVNATTVDVGDTVDARPRYGSLTLRYSPRCRAAWPLFVSNENVPAVAVIHLETTRGSDGTVTAFDYPFLVQAKVYSVFGNLLQTTRGCVSVAIEIRAAEDRRSLAVADTPCVALGRKVR